MALINPSNLYSEGQVNLDSTPYLRMQQQQQAKKQAREDALYKYFSELPTKINSAGMRVQDIVMLMVVVLLVLLGLCFGSFVNAFVWRFHMQASAKTKIAKAKYSIVRGRSVCVDCKHQLASKDLLPVVSWLALKGKCRYCKKPIHWQYPLIELITARVLWYSYANGVISLMVRRAVANRY